MTEDLYNLRSGGKGQTQVKVMAPARVEVPTLPSPGESVAHTFLAPAALWFLSSLGTVQLSLC